MDQGLCRHADGDIWFPDPAAPVASAKSIEVAKAICLGCPVKGSCLEDARNREETNGIWGGVWFFTSREGVVER